MWKRTAIVSAAVLVLLLVIFLFYLLLNEPEQEAVYDLNNDGILEEYHLTGGRLAITQPDGINWVSSPEWDVQSFALDDVTGDGNPELLMVLWKRGCFGAHKPLFYDQEDNNYSCHLFLYQIVKDKMLARWCSSALERPIKSFTVQVDSAGNKFLAVEEGRYSTYCAGHPIFLGREYTNWAWNHWGFSQVGDGS